MIVAADDPHLERLRQLEQDGLANVRILPAVVARLSRGSFSITSLASSAVKATARCVLESVEVREHAGKFGELSGLSLNRRFRPASLTPKFPTLRRFEQPKLIRGYAGRPLRRGDRGAIAGASIASSVSWNVP